MGTTPQRKTQMQKLSFVPNKPSPGTRSVRCGRHQYSRSHKRGIFVPFGTVFLDADPDALDSADALPHGIYMDEGNTLSREDVDVLRAWLREYGDKDAQAAHESLRRCLRAQLQEELRHGREDAHDVLQAAANAMVEAVHGVDALAAAMQAAGRSPHKELRKSYLTIIRSAKKLTEVGQMFGFATRQLNKRRTTGTSS